MIRQPTDDEIADAREEAAYDRAIRARTFRNMLNHFRGEPPEEEPEEEDDD